MKVSPLESDYAYANQSTPDGYMLIPPSTASTWPVT